MTTTINSDRPIGIFDSGVGGLTVLKAVRALLPGEDIVYLGDTARVPYGTKSKETVQRFSRENSRFLISHHVKALVVACNTSSSLALGVIRRLAGIPVIGVVDPGARAAVAATSNRRVGVIGTEATIGSGAYQRALRRLNSSLEVTPRPCPMFVPLAENGWLENRVAYETALIYLAPLKEAEVDTLILGCTHYPLLKKTIAEVMGPAVTLIDSAHETALSLRDILTRKNLWRSAKKGGRSIFYVTDNPAKFAVVGKNFLGTNTLKAKLCRLTEEELS